MARDRCAFTRSCRARARSHADVHDANVRMCTGRVQTWKQVHHFALKSSFGNTTFKSDCISALINVLNFL